MADCRPFQQDADEAKLIMKTSDKTLRELYSEHGGKVSDKWGMYLSEYDRIFREYREEPIKILEIGVQNGGSLEIWSKYFKNGLLFIGCDIDSACAGLRFEDPRIVLVIGDANADSTREEILSHGSELDVVIDDGSHNSSDIVKSFMEYFPSIVDGGTYIVEDLHASYWREYEGGLFYPFSSLSFFKRLVDITNSRHWGVERSHSEILQGFREKYEIAVREEILQHIHSIEFLNSLCVVRKSRPIDNELGPRFIGGRMAEVWPDVIELRDSLLPPPPQTSNPWSARARPPDEEITEREQEVQALSEKLAERDKQVEALTAQAAHRKQSVQDLSRKLAERDKQVEALMVQVADRDQSVQAFSAQMADLGDRLAERDRTIISLNEQVEGLQHDLTQTQSDLEALRPQLMERERQVAGMVQSLSWRLTSPLRFTKRLLGSLGRGVLRRRHRLAPRPLHQVRPLVGSIDEWESTGNDPQFMLDMTRSHFLGGWTRIEAEIAYNADCLPNPTLYVDSGSGFSESQSYRLGFSEGGAVRTLLLLPRGVLNIRFDPADQQAHFRLSSTTLQEVSKLEAHTRLLITAISDRIRREGGLLPLLQKVHHLVQRGGTKLVVQRLHEEALYASPTRRSVRSRSAAARHDHYLDDSALTQESDEFSYRPLISVVMPTYNTPRGYVQSAIASVQGQLYPKWELCICDDASTSRETVDALREVASKDKRIKVAFSNRNGGISTATNKAVEMAQGDFIALLDHDDELARDALHAVVKLLNEDSDADVVYTDQDKIDRQGRPSEPFYKPDWSPVMLRCVMYVGHLLVIKRGLWQELGGLDPNFDGVQDYEIMLRVSEVNARVRHIPRILYHWRKIPGSVAFGLDEKAGIEELQVGAVRAHLARSAVPAVAARHPRHRHRVIIQPKRPQVHPLVGIVIPTKDAPDLIGRCLQSVFEASTYPSYEVVVVDNQTTDEDALSILRSYPLKIVPLNERFNYSRANNLGVQEARGDYVVLLNNDTEVITPDWLEQLLFHVTLPNVGAVGPLLIYPNRTVQHAGVVLGFRGTADHVMRGFPVGADGYAGSLCCPREVSAVTGACMMMRRSDYLALGGMIEHYASHYQDLDLCLRVVRSGKRILYVPHTVLVHHESASRGGFYDYIDRALLLDTWGSLIADGDRFYNPNFSLETPDYALG